jgi:hypothetical protein
MFWRFDIPAISKNMFMHVFIVFVTRSIQVYYKLLTLFMPMFLPCFYHVFHRFLFQLYMFEGNVWKDHIISFKHSLAFCQSL